MYYICVHTDSASLTANFELDSVSRGYSSWQKDKVYMHRDGAGQQGKTEWRWMQTTANVTILTCQKMLVTLFHDIQNE